METLLCDFCRLNFPCHPFLTFSEGRAGCGARLPFPVAREAQKCFTTWQEKLEIEPMIFSMLTRNTTKAIELVPINTTFTLLCTL